MPCDDDMRAAADVLNAGRKTVILAGQGALGAADELEQLADVMAAPIVKPLLGKGAVPDDSPFTTGGIGLLGTEPSEIAMEEADTLLMVGTSFPYMEFYPKHDRCRGVQIDRDAVAHRPAVSGRSRALRRREGDAAGAAAAHPPARRSLVPREGPGRHEGVARAAARRVRTATTCR